MKQDDYCSLNCPYLRQVSVDETPRLPFYCDLFRVFLGVELKNVCRCELCIGKPLNAGKDGFRLISSYSDTNIDKRKTKWGFHRLSPVARKRFIQVVRQSGIMVGLDGKTALNSAHVIQTLEEKISEIMDMPAFKTAQAESFSGLIDKIGEDFPGLIKDSTKDLLSNLFLSLDPSEQDFMQSLLSNPGRVEDFVKEVEDMPKNDHMVKDLRRTLDEEKNKMVPENGLQDVERQRMMRLAIQRQSEQHHRNEEQKTQNEKRAVQSVDGLTKRGTTDKQPDQNRQKIRLGMENEGR